eukprot:410273-Pleurochrysis_carterae.AAC.3
MRMRSRPLPSYFSAYACRVGTLVMMLRILSLSALSTEASASGAMIKLSLWNGEGTERRNRSASGGSCGGWSGDVRCRGCCCRELRGMSDG